MKQNVLSGVIGALLALSGYSFAQDQALRLPPPKAAAVPPSLQAAATAAAKAAPVASEAPANPVHSAAPPAALMQPQQESALVLPARTPAAAPAPAPPAATIGVAASTSAASAQVTPAPATASVRPTPHVVRKPKPKAKNADPYADIPVPAPGREALRRSNQWATNDKASVSAGPDGRVVFTFGETMPTVVCAPLHMCDIELQPGENVVGKPQIGDPRFGLEPAIAGEGDARVVHAIIKPREAGLETNLIIPTDRRMYRLRIVSDESNYVSVVSFDYPQDQAKAWDAAIAGAAAKAAPVVEKMPSLTADNLDFAYRIKVEKGKPAWTPIRAFADGSHTYIQLSPDASVTEAPAFLLIGADGKEELVNFRLKGSFFVIDRIVDKAVLVSGVGGSAERVTITHGCKSGLFAPKCGG